MFRTLWKGGALALLVLSIPFALALTSPGGANEPPPPQVNSQLAGVLLRTGLSAETLCAAGITSVQVPALIGAFEGQYNAVTLAGLDQAYVQAKGTRDELVRKVRSGLGTSSDVTALAQAETDFTSAKNAREGYVNGLRGTALATVSAAQAAIVQTIQANNSWGFPAQYLVKNRSEANWVALRDALDTKRIASQYGEPYPLEAQTFLAGVDAEPEIAAAKVLLDTNLASVQTAWNSAAAD